MATFSNALRLINAVGDFNGSSLGMTENELIDYFHNVFKDDKTYAEFYLKARSEMIEELYNYLKLCCGVYGFSEDEDEYIYNHLNKVSNPFISVSDNYNNLWTEFFYDASGYLGYNLSDSEFEEFRGFVDEEVPVLRYIKIMAGKKLGNPFEENDDIFSEYALRKGISKQIFYSKKETTKESDTEVSVANFKATQICDIHIERSSAGLVYAIINTSNYCGDMGVTIVKCCTTIALEDYGFNAAERIGIGRLDVGETFTSINNGSGCVVVRIA